MVGWWLVERRGKIGWIPSSYLKKTKVDDDEDYDTSPYLGLVGAAGMCHYNTSIISLTTSKSV